jgi:glycosyltransferase involved in cell wall biosynthesis
LEKLIMKRLNILLSAYACEPGKGSEPGVGWNVAVELASFHNVWVITRANNRHCIEAELSRHPVPGLQFVYFDLPRWAAFWKRGRRGIRLYYYLWQIGILRLARRLHRQIRFDLVHHVSMVKYWVPSFLSLLPMPMIWGPVGGGESAPKGFWRDFGLRGMLFEAVREMMRWIGERDPFVRMTARRSAIAMATTRETAARLRALGAKRVELLSESGLPASEIIRLGARALTPESKPVIRFASVGQLLHLKGFHLGLRAFAEAGIPRAEYWVIGGGPERARLELLACQLCIDASVRFFGALPRDETLRRIEECDVLVHPTLHDSGGWVCLEAMAVGRPVICLDLGGPATQVTTATGILVPGKSQNQAVHDLCVAMQRVARDDALRWRMGRAARERVARDFHYAGKIRRLNAIYTDVLDAAIR